MIHSELIAPKSIAVIGGSDNTFKPGGKVLENLINGGFKKLYVVNPKADTVQGITSYKDIDALPKVDLAILAIPARFCYDTIVALAEKGVKAYIILSAGFKELDDEGRQIEDSIKKYALKNNLSILGPNCIGIINEHYSGVFTTPVPAVNPKGINFISGSGSTAVFVMEAGMKMGMQFSGIYSVGNAMQLQLEDFLEYFDDNYVQGESPDVLMLYIEQLSSPKRLLRHSKSLIRKGCRIIAIKAGLTTAGSRAASSHTGAMATPALTIRTIFEEAGIIQCSSREEMLYVAGVLFYGKPLSANTAIITHAGGAGVMCADALEQNGMSVPALDENPKAQELLQKLYRGASVANPIDFLATGTAEQLSLILDYCDNEFEDISQNIVIFGSPGLFDVSPVYDVIADKTESMKKPLYPVMPSPVNTAEAMQKFIDKGKIFFPDEVVLAQALAKVYHTPDIIESKQEPDEKIRKTLSHIVKSSTNRYLSPQETYEFLKAADIPQIDQVEIDDLEQLKLYRSKLKFPVAMKVIGPIHKTDVGGVILNVNNIDEALKHFIRLMQIPDAKAVLIQPMLDGIELYAGAIRDDKAGHIVMAGMGGIYLETIKDISTALAPVEERKAQKMIDSLKSYPVLKGIRGKKGVNIEKFKKIIVNLSLLLVSIPEISEIDINPLIAIGNDIFAVDCRIKLIASE